jgi:hypothetical protein
MPDRLTIVGCPEVRHSDYFQPRFPSVVGQ